MRGLALALLLLPFSLPEAHALSSCRDAWRGSDYGYNFREGYSAFHKRLKRSACAKDWTVLVYMAADNDLFPYALWDLYEMEARFESERNSAGSTLKTDLLVQVDGPAKDDLRRLHIFSGPVKYAAKSKADFVDGSLNDVRSPVVSRLRESDRKSERERLEEFLRWGAKEYPAKNYMVIVWGHGQGWKAYPVKNKAKGRNLRAADLDIGFPEPVRDAGFGGIGFRESANSWLDIPALRSALDSFRRATGKPVDVYASDACLMQMLEVSFELSSSARFVVGSTQVQNFLGLPYRRLLYELNTGRFNGMRRANRAGVDGSDEAYLLAKMIPALVKQSLDPTRGSQGRADREAQRFITSSSLSSSDLQRLLVPDLRKLGAALKRYLLEEPMRAMDLLFVMQNVPALEGSAQDFGIFLGFLELQLKEEAAKNGLSPAAAELRRTVAQAKDTLNMAVLSYAYGAAYGIDERTRTVGFIPRAVSLWLPVAPEEYRLRRNEFSVSRLYQETRWHEWLDLVFPR